MKQVLRKVAKIACVASLMSGSAFLASPAWASLVDGAYTIDGAFLETGPTLSGSFDVMSGLITNLSVTTSSSGATGANSIYQGPGTNQSTGTMFSASLTLTNRSSLATGVGFLDFSTDGTFTCGGLSAFGASNLCQITTQFFGDTHDGENGTYHIVASTTPLPATLPLFAGGLGALGLLSWRRKRKPHIAFQS